MAIGVSSLDVFADHPFSVLVKIESESAWGCLGAEAPKLTYSIAAAEEGENPRKGASSTRLVQDITPGATFHFVNIDTLSLPERPALPGDTFDISVELTRADESTVASSHPMQIVVANSPGSYAAKFGDRIEFNREGLPSFIRAIIGFSVVENWGRWTDANKAEAAEIHFQSDLPENFDLAIEYWSFGPNAGQPVLVRCGSCIATFMASANQETVRVRIRPLAPARCITIRPYSPTSPLEQGLGGDDRRLGLALIAIKIESCDSDVDLPSLN
jgi:hypothetical protein